MPRDITDNLWSKIAKLLKSPAVKERLAAPGMEPAGSTSAQFAEFARRENTQRSKVVKSAGMQAE